MSEQVGGPLRVLEEQRVPGNGTFTYLSDGSVSATFEDNALVHIKAGPSPLKQQSHSTTLPSSRYSLDTPNHNANHN